MLQRLKKLYETIEWRFVYNPQSEELWGEENPPVGARALFRAQLYSTLLFLALNLLASLLSWNWLHSFAFFFLFVFLYSGSLRRLIVGKSGQGYPGMEAGDAIGALIAVPIYLVITIVIHNVLSSLWIG
jgi:hypothetical protein